RKVHLQDGHAEHDRHGQQKESPQRENRESRQSLRGDHLTILPRTTMIYPIVAYGNPILKKEAEEITEGTDLTSLIKDMYDTMDFANGVGLAAPQINQGVRLFVIDSSLMLDEDDEEKGIRRVFINPIIVE